MDKDNEIKGPELDPPEYINKSDVFRCVPTDISKKLDIFDTSNDSLARALIISQSNMIDRMSAMYLRIKELELKLAEYERLYGPMKNREDEL